MLSKELNEITEKQLEMQEKFRSIPNEGAIVNYLGKEFIVFKEVFHPFDDSMPLVKNFRVFPNESVLDVCTGSGVIAIFTAYKGANRVVALDINPESVRNAKENVIKDNFQDTIKVIQSDMFENLEPNIKFDVITGNLPFRDKPSKDFVEGTMWDTNLETHKKFFREASNFLKPNGRIYLSQANFGAVREMKELAEQEGFRVNLIGKGCISKKDPRVFYAFELKKEISPLFQ